MGKQLTKYILIALGFFFIALGLIGVFIPVLPTVPFMLLAAFCFLKSSESLYNWLVNHKKFGAPIKSFMEHKALKKSTKIKAITSIWLSLILSMCLVQAMHVTIILILTGLALTAYLLSFKTLELQTD
jgi:uncharacterized membrane protein YbaN (DUF454 family)